MDLNFVISSFSSSFYRNKYVLSRVQWKEILTSSSPQPFVFWKRFFSEGQDVNLGDVNEMIIFFSTLAMDVVTSWVRVELVFIVLSYYSSIDIHLQLHAWNRPGEKFRRNLILVLINSFLIQWGYCTVYIQFSLTSFLSLVVAFFFSFSVLGPIFFTSPLRSNETLSSFSPRTHQPTVSHSLLLCKILLLLLL